MILKAPVKWANLQYTYDLWEVKPQNYIGFIYFVRPWVIILSVSSKSIHQSKLKLTIWSDIFPWKLEVLELLC